MRAINVKDREKRGFTLVELSLSMAFVSILSITVALIISNTIATYHRGVILNQINTVGMELVDDMRFSIQSAQVMKCASGGDCTSVQAFGNVKKGGTEVDKMDNIPKYGAICTGSYSYLWNSGYLFEGNPYKIDGNKLSVSYNGEGSPKKDFKLLKILDKKRVICSKDLSNDNIDLTGNNFEVINEEPVDLMSDSGGLVIYDLNAVSTTSNAVNGAFYSVSFILGTIQGGINVKADSNYCKTPGDSSSADIEALDYCAINKFNFAAQANGGTGK